MANDQRIKVQFYISPETREQDELIQEYLDDSKDRPSSLAREAMLAACALKEIDPRLVSTIAAMYRRGTQGEFIAKLISSFASWEATGDTQLKEGAADVVVSQTAAAPPPPAELLQAKTTKTTPADTKAETDKPVSAAVKQNFSPL